MEPQRLIWDWIAGVLEDCITSCVLRVAGYGFF